MPMAEHKLSAVLELKDRYSSAVKKSVSATEELASATTSATKTVEKTWMSATGRVQRTATRDYKRVSKSAVEEATKTTAAAKGMEKGVAAAHKGISTSATEELKKASGGFKLVEKGATQAATVVTKKRAAFNSFASAAAKAGRDAGNKLRDGVVNNVKKIPSAIGGILKGIGGGILTGMGMGFASSITGLISSAIGGIKKTVVGGFFQYAELEDQLIRNRLIMEASAGDTERLKAQVKHLGATTRYTELEVAQAHKYQAMSGYSAEDALRVTPTLLKLANVEGLDLGVTSNIITSSMSAFGLSIDEVERFCDVLAITGKRTAVSLEDLGESFKYAALATSGRESYEDVALMLGLGANANIKGGQAGRQMRGLYSIFSDPTDEVRKQMQKVGMKAFDKHGNARSLIDIIKESKPELDKMSQQEQLDWFKVVVGDTNAPLWRAIMNAPDEVFDRVKESIEGADGVLKKFNAELAKESPLYAIQSLQGAWSAFKTNVGQAVAPMAIQEMEKLTKYLQSDAFSPDKVVNFFKTIQEWTKNVSPLVATLGRGLESIANIIESKQIKKEDPRLYKHEQGMNSLKKRTSSSAYMEVAAASITEGLHDELYQGREMRGGRVLQEYKNHAEKHPDMKGASELREAIASYERQKLISPKSEARASAGSDFLDGFDYQPTHNINLPEIKLDITTESKEEEIKKMVSDVINSALQVIATNLSIVQATQS